MISNYKQITQGLAAAAGCQLVAASDIVIASTRSQFSVPGIQSFSNLFYLIFKNNIQIEPQVRGLDYSVRHHPYLSQEV